MKALYYQCQSGISGDMNLGAMLDLGVCQKKLLEGLSKLALDEFYEIDIKKDHKSHLYGTKVSVKEKNQKHVHRNFADIKEIIEKSTLSSFVKRKSIDMFWALAVAEGKVHNKEPQSVHFHEVGAIDSIVDIVGSAICFEILNVDVILCSSVELGSGYVNSAHGKIPIPAPATLQIFNNIKNAKVKIGGVETEATTPTGAVILACNVTQFSDKVSFCIQKVGYGIGQKDFIIPNILRVYLVELEDSFMEEDEIMLETNIDDMNPEVLSYVQEKLFSIGVKDVFTTAITTKKNRIGTKLSVLTSLDKEFDASKIIFKESSSIGLRSYKVKKRSMQRKTQNIKTKYGEVPVKFSFIDDICKYKAEFEDCKKLALKNNVCIKDIYEEVNFCIKKNENEKI